jgi:hypothetical protein
MRHRCDIRTTDLGWTVYCDGEPWGWVRRGEDTETLPAGTYLAVSRHPLRIAESGHPLATLADAVAALSRAEVRT